MTTNDTNHAAAVPSRVAADILTADIADLHRTRRRITAAVWGIAVGVMIYGAINVTGLLIDHGVWPHVAWLLSVMIDLAMCVGLIGDRVLHQYARQDRWVTALRWSTAVMTLILNTARPALAHDWVGVGIHTAGPVLLLLVAEAAGSFQRQLTAIIRDLRTDLTNVETAERDNETGPGRHNQTSETTLDLAAAPPPRPSLATATSVSVETPDRAACPATRLPSGTPSLTHTITSGTHPARVRPRNPGVPTAHDQTRDDRPQTTADSTLTLREAMWEHWCAHREAGHRVTGADLDRAFGTNNYGRRVIKEWTIAGRITDTDTESKPRPATPTPAVSVPR